MKSKYIIPALSECPADTLPLCASLDIQSSGTGLGSDLGYGDIDNDGTVDPSANERNDWEEGIW